MKTKKIPIEQPVTKFDVLKLELEALKNEIEVLKKQVSELQARPQYPMFYPQPNFTPPTYQNGLIQCAVCKHWFHPNTSHCCSGYQITC